MDITAKVIQALADRRGTDPKDITTETKFADLSNR